MEKLPFIPNHVYKRSEIHDQYGGNRQGGIAPSARVPYIFIFSGKSGSQYGYKDGWDNPNVFSYTGEGQEGDMKFVKGNLALRDHIENGKRVFLFEYERSGYVKFICELEFFDVESFETLDLNKANRTAIMFFFKRKGSYLPVNPEQLHLNQVNETIADYLEASKPSKTERSGIVTLRVGQGAFRQKMIHRWQYQCAVTKFNKVELLIASHIVSWSKSSDRERTDVHNGILLSPVYDALFDKHLISFDHKGNIILSDSIEQESYKQIGVTGKEKIQNLSRYNLEYLDRHREMLI